VADRIVYLESGRARLFDGKYSEFRESLLAAEVPVKIRNRSGPQAYAEFKERSRVRSKHKKKIESTKSRIAESEKELEELEIGMTESLPRDDWEQLQAASNRKKEVENLILNLYAELESLEETEID
jgi:ATPase subunit of ABC transporter with duplicated ATPase domains